MLSIARDYLGDEYAAIGQSGEEVELRHPLELTFGLLASRNFAGRREQDIPPAEGGPAQRDFGPEQPPILCLAAPLERFRRPRSRLLHRRTTGPGACDGWFVLGEIADVQLKQLVARVTEYLIGTPIDLDKVPGFEVMYEYEVIDEVEKMVWGSALHFAAMP